MFFNHLKIAWRYLKKHKLISLINIISLSLGITCTLLILLYIQHETSYDKFHLNGDHIFRLTSEFKPNDKVSTHFARCANAWRPWMDALKADYPEIKNIARLMRTENTTIRIGNNKLREKYFFYTDSEIFDVFSIDLIEGDSQTVLENLNSIILTETLAKKYYNQNPVGETIQIIDGQGNTSPFMITGVMKDWPQNSHMDIQILASLPEKDRTHEWAYTYLLLNNTESGLALEAKLPDFSLRHFGEIAAARSGIHLQKLTDIHLHSNLDRELKINGNADTILVLWVIAILISLIASINYINLTTAQSSKRAKEIGIKKTIGSPRSQLMQQFLTESLLVMIFAMLLSCLFIICLIPELNLLTGKQFNFSSFGNGVFWFQITGFLVVMCLLAGLYPAVILSGFKPVQILNKGAAFSNNSSKKLSLRSLLVTMQFIIVTILLISTFILRGQLNFIHNKSLGMNKDQVISVGENIPQPARAKLQQFKQRLTNENNVVSISACMQEPADEVKDVGSCYVESKFEGNDKAYLYFFPVDENFIDVLELELLAGQTFPAHHLNYDKITFQHNSNFIKEINEAKRSYIINETAMHHIGWKSAQDAIGKKMDINNVVLNLQRGPIIGVVKDFNFSTLHKEVKPFVLMYEPRFFGSFLIKLRPNNMPQSILKIQNVWDEMFPDYPFEYHFMDDLYARLYQSERQFNAIIIRFTVVAILIGCLGLLGLILFTTEQKTKEIGIRKVMGSSVTGILSLLTGQYLKWIVIANFIAWPLAWYFMNQWLQNFAYRINLTMWPFLLAGLCAVLIALFTVSWQAIRAATANPVESLKYE